MQKIQENKKVTLNKKGNKQEIGTSHKNQWRKVSGKKRRKKLKVKITNKQENPPKLTMGARRCEKNLRGLAHLPNQRLGEGACRCDIRCSERQIGITNKITN
jgi:predicted transcriptional regulator